jgi:hypothetical protein
MLDYNTVRSVPEEEFVRSTATQDELDDPARFTKATPEDLRRIERLLDVVEGTLEGQDHYIEKTECPCGEVLTSYDFVFTSLVDAGHPKSFVLHTFVGTKRIVNPPRGIRCSKSGHASPELVRGYQCGPGYGCPPSG